MTISLDIRSGLQKRARSVGGLPAEVAVEGVFFSPTVGTPFVSFKLQPTSEQPASVGPAGMTRVDGLFLIDLCYPNKMGTGDAEEMADLVKSAFRSDPEITEGNARVRVLYAQRGPVLLEPDWIRVPVTVRFYAFILTVD